MDICENHVAQMRHCKHAPHPGSQRIDVLDIAKGIGIILVVFAHINYTPSILVSIYSFHMPLFFIMSGIVFFRDRYSTFQNFLVKRLKRLILPYLFFSLVPIFASVILNQIFGISVLVHNGLPDALWQTLVAKNSSTVVNPPLWFVPCLLAVEIMYYFISKLPKPLAAAVCVLLAGLGWVLESGLIPVIPLPWSLDSALFALVFFATGNLCAPYLKSSIQTVKGHRHKVLLCLTALFFCFVLWYPAAQANGKVSMGSKILNNGFLLYWTGTVGTIGMVAVSMLLENVRFLKYLGRNTFCIMAVHCLLKGLLIKAIEYIPGISMYSEDVLGETVVPFLIVFTFSVLSTFLYNAVVRFLHSPHISARNA